MKIHLIGGAGSGKSYVAKALSQKLRIPHYDLDDIFWDNQSDTYGIKAPEEQRDRQLLDIVNQENWIVEGVYRSWVDPSFARADRIIVLLPPLALQEERIWKRYEERMSGAVTGVKRETYEGTQNLIAWNKEYNLKKLPHFLEHNEYKYKLLTVKDNLDVLDLFQP